MRTRAGESTRASKEGSEAAEATGVSPPPPPPPPQRPPEAAPDPPPMEQGLRDWLGAAETRAQLARVIAAMDREAGTTRDASLDEAPEGVTSRAPDHAAAVGAAAGDGAPEADGPTPDPGSWSSFIPQAEEVYYDDDIIKALEKPASFTSLSERLRELPTDTRLPIEASTIQNEWRARLSTEARATEQALFAIEKSARHLFRPLAAVMEQASGSEPEAREDIVTLTLQLWTVIDKIQDQRKRVVAAGVADNARYDGRNTENSLFSEDEVKSMRQEARFNKARATSAGRGGRGGRVDRGGPGGVSGP